MLRVPELPFQPGYVFDRKIGQTRFHKSQHFNIVENVPMLADKDKPGIGGERYRATGSCYPSIYPRGEAVDLPPWIVYDKQILKFDAFFQETMQEVSGSPFQIREVKIYFFLEDGTVQINEPPIPNSGMNGGCLVRRQRVPFPPPRHYYYYDIIDFNVGREVEIYGRVYKITSCDNFTRVFLNRCGIPVPDPISAPEDPYKLLLIKEKSIKLPKKPRFKQDTLGPFLKFDKQVLRFWGYWDDRETEFGILHNIELHYFLSDGTVQIKDVIPPNSGRDCGPMLLKRIKLPKRFTGLPLIGEATPVSLLNVLEGPTGFRYVDDMLNCGDKNNEFYNERDFVIGAVINCFGRKIVLTDCDAFTKEFYRTKYGIDDFTPASIPSSDAVCLQAEERRLPPWNGYGSHIDSEINCRQIYLKPLVRDLKDFLNKDRYGYNSFQLRFSARMISKRDEDADRYFIISYYLADKTMSIFELACRNTGFYGGQFLRRMEVPVPGQEKFTIERPKLYQPQDLYVGAILKIFDYTFKLVDADEYCFNYMQLHKDEFPLANIDLIMYKLREALRPIYRQFLAEHIPKGDKPIIDYDTLRYALCQNMKENPLTEHEMIMIARSFVPPCSYQRFSRNEIRQIVLTELKRGLWNDLERFKEHLKQMDPQKTGFLPKFECYNLVRAAKLPLDIEIINAMFDVICKNENCEINYLDLINFIDLTYEPLPDVPPENYKRKLSWLAEKVPKLSKTIDWCAFNKALNLENEIVQDKADRSSN